MWYLDWKKSPLVIAWSWLWLCLCLAIYLFDDLLCVATIVVKCSFMCSTLTTIQSVLGKHLHLSFGCLSVSLSKWTVMSNLMLCVNVRPTRGLRQPVQPTDLQATTASASPSTVPARLSPVGSASPWHEQAAYERPSAASRTNTPTSTRGTDDVLQCHAAADVAQCCK